MTTHPAIMQDLHKQLDRLKTELAAAVIEDRTRLEHAVQHLEDLIRKLEGKPNATRNP